MATFDENGNYVKTDWKAGDKITAAKLNKIEESIEAVNNNDISRHVEADARLDKLESGTVSDKQAINAKVDALEDVVEANKDAADLEIYSINAHMTLLDKKIDDGVAEVEAIANTVDGKIAAAETNMQNQVNQGKADMEAMVAEVEGELDEINNSIEQVLTNNGYTFLQKTFIMPNPNGVDDTEVFNSIPPDYTTIVFQEGTYILDKVKLRSHSIYEGLKYRTHIKPKNDIAFTWEGMLEFVEIRNLCFVGPGCAIKYTNPYDYFSTINIHHCEFFGSLNECITANMILCDISHNSFGIFGNVNGTHSHIKSIGDPTSYQTNINVIQNNRFYSATDYCIYFEFGWQIKITDNNFERLNCIPVRLYGLFLNDIRGNWFENNNAAHQILYNNDSQGLIGNYVCEVTQNFFAMVHQANVRIIRAVGAATLTFTHNAGSQCADKYVCNDDADGYAQNTTYYANRLTGYNGNMKNKYPLLPKSGYSLKGVNDDVWFKNWTTSSADIKKVGVLSWSSTTDSDYIGKVIECTLCSSHNFVYMTLPVAYFKGKTIRIQGIAKAVITNDVLRMAYNFNEVIPTRADTVGNTSGTSGTFSLEDEYTERYLDVTVPDDAVALHFGFYCGGNNQNKKIQLKALNLFIIENGSTFNTHLL